MSSTTSPTGVNPPSWTACRQDTYNLMRADYKANTSAPATRGGKWYRWIRNRANGKEYTGSGCPGGTCYADGGQYAAFIVQAEGCAATTDAGPTFASRAYARMDAFLDSREKLGYEAAPYNFVRKLGDSNPVREKMVRLVRMAATIKPCITGLEYERLKVGIAEQLQSALMGGYTHTVPLNDSDNIVGFYFAVVVQYLLEPNYQLAVDNFNNVNNISPKLCCKVGGLASTNTPEQYLLASGTKNMRNAIRMYVEYLGEDGAWIESGEYDLHTVALLIEGYDAIKTLTGTEHFPEIATWLPKHATFLLNVFSPDLKRMHKWSDTEHPRDPLLNLYAQVAMQVAGVLKGTTEGRKLHDLLVELGDLHGLTGRDGIEPNAVNSNPFILYDPYETQVEWRDTTSVSDRNVRIASRKSHASDTNASQWFVYCGGPQRWLTANNASASVHHAEVNYQSCSSDLYRNGAYALTYIQDYGGPTGTGRDGSNTVLIHGRGQQGRVFVKFTPTHHANFSSVVKTTGGEKLVGRAYCGMRNTPDIFLHEWTRSEVYLPRTARTATDVVVTHDRVNALTTIPTAHCYTTAEANSVAPYDAVHHKLLINHASTLPVLSGNAYTWDGPAGVGGNNPVKMTIAYPTTFNSTIVNELTDMSTMPGWSRVAKSERKYHVRNWPTNTQQWNTFLTVKEVGTAGAVNAKTDEGKVEGAHIVRPGEADALVLFNAEQGANLVSTAAHTSHQTDLSGVRYRGTGFTVSWTAVASTTWGILNDLNPANTWTYTLDGGASTPITEDANGQAYIPFSGTGAHTLVVTGS